MANKKINELSTRTPSLTDLILVGDPTSGYSYKCTVTALATIIETDIADAYVTLDTAQTISGAKTFSNNLTLTSVTNAATTQTKFLTLNGSNVVNYRTGSQVLADIGASDDTLVVHKAGDETITGIKTFSARGKFDAGINLKQGSGASLDTGYSAISADATTFYFHRATSIAALSVNNLTTTRTYTLQDANGTLAFLSDIPSLTGYVPTSRTLTINGTSYDLSANRTWSVGTVTSVGLSTGTTGTDISVSGSPVTSSGTITLNIPTASATNRGALSSTDWSTFNNKQNALTLTTTGTSGAATLVGSTLNIPQYQSVLTNPVTGTGTTNYIPKFTSSSAIGNSNLYEGTYGIGLGTTGPQSSLNNLATTIQVYQNSANGSSLKLSSALTNTELYQADGAFYIWNYGGSGAPILFGTNNTERMRLTSAGNLGIGTSSPAAKLHVDDGAGAALYIGLSTNNYYRAYEHIWQGINGTTERMRLDASGNLGIGTSSPTAKLTVSGTTSDQIRVYEVTDATNYYRIGRNSTTGFLDFYGNQSGYVGYVWGGINGTRMTLDASGNLGLGVTPSAWGSAWKASQVQQFGIATLGADEVDLSLNAYNDNNGWLYINTNYATQYRQGSGSHKWFIAPSGTAGNAISFTQAMTLDASGNLGVGSTTPSTSLGGAKGLVINSGAIGDAQFRLQNNNTGSASSDGALLSLASDNSMYLYNYENAAINFGTNNAIRAVITGSGNVGIGTTSPTSKLTIVSNSPVSTDIGFSGGIGTGTEYASLRFRADTYNWTSAEIRGVATNGGVNLGVLQFFTSDAERMRITSGGNVGIGTTSPTGLLHLYGANPAFRIQNSGTGNMQFGQWDGTYNRIQSSGRDFLLISTDATNLLFSTNDAERMRITSGGELLINTTSDAGDYKLQVNGSQNLGSTSLGQTILNIVSSTTGVSDIFFSDNVDNRGVIRYDHTSDFMSLWTAGGERMRITSGGNVGIGTTSPSQNLHVASSGVSRILIENTANASTGAGLQMLVTSGGTQVGNGTIRTDNSDNMQFFNLGGERMRITSGGQVGIGLTNPTAALEVNGGIKTSAPLGGTAQQWKFGSKVNATVVLITGSYIELEVGGTLYKLALVN